MLTLRPLREAGRTRKAKPRTEHILRRTLDLGTAVLLLLLAAPALLCAALAITLTSLGPVFYRQERVGRHGRLFRIWKLRTMTANGPCGPAVTAQDDPRITPLGRCLRSWKIDELPQLLNVICGEMSLVGPRPQVPRFVDCFDPERRRLVLSVRPGMTGLSALRFRHEEFLLMGQPDREQCYVTRILPVKLALEAEYVQARCLRGDLALLLDTLRLVLLRVVGRAGHSGIPAVMVLPDASWQQTSELQPTSEPASVNELACIA